MTKASEPGDKSHFITLQQAIDMTTRYRDNKNNVISPDYAGKNIIALSDTFPREVFDKLLSKSGCSGIRIYYGMDTDLKVHPIVVAINANNEDILPDQSATSTLDGEDIGDDAMRCPPLCPPPSPLNQ